ncbi:hypothetical protein Salat_0851500 [Sesamum alatum]|uniref:Reverse transcriptase zinc-binding domain-containing protein n=1 Tax=Sesamum alatum TaxID=300844 RepID=A0AAE2CQK5_9LAMI|nr:hypothetical protein Salat_0851500 [Sesamum alatum]
MQQNLQEQARLSDVIMTGNWHWRMGRASGSLGLAARPPLIHGAADTVRWKPAANGKFSTSLAIVLFTPSHACSAPVWTYGWAAENPEELIHSLAGNATQVINQDKPWLLHHNGDCVLFSDEVPETHEHLFFQCSFSTRCLAICKQEVKLQWTHSDWDIGIRSIAKRWRGNHPLNAVPALACTQMKGRILSQKGDKIAMLTVFRIPWP